MSKYRKKFAISRLQPAFAVDGLSTIDTLTPNASEARDELMLASSFTTLGLASSGSNHARVGSILGNHGFSVHICLLVSHVVIISYLGNRQL